MKIGDRIFAVVDSTGAICGDGECASLNTNRELAEQDLQYAREHGSGTAPYRIAEVRITEGAAVKVTRREPLPFMLEDEDE